MSEFEYFASGTNEPGQIWGFARIGHPLGIAAHECMGRGGCEQALLDVARAYPAQRVFIDSGAFSEVEFVPGEGMVATEPITDAEWRDRLAFMQRIADAYGPRALIIAPDQIANQKVTLERLRRYRPEVEGLARAGAEVGVVLQGGELTPAQFEDATIEALGWDGFVRSFPMMKGAATPDDLREYFAIRSPRRVHLLGVGPRAIRKAGRPSGQDLLDLFAEAAPASQVSWDSALIPAKVGRDKRIRLPSGRVIPGGRMLTRAQDIQAHDVVAEAFGPTVEDPFGGGTYDWTEAEPYDYLGPLWGAEAVRSARDSGSKAKIRKAEKAYTKRAMETAGRAGLEGPDAEAFVRDPNAFVHAQDEEGHERWESDVLLANELEEEFAAWVVEGSAQLRKERSIVGAFAPDQPEPEGPPVQVFAPFIHPKSHRVIRGKKHELYADEDPEEVLHRHRRPEKGQQLTLLKNARRRELKRKLMR